MNKPPFETLREGCEILDPLMNKHGFFFADGPAGNSSGGPFASGSYVNANRKLELHFRFELGLVTYHFGQTCIDHESYMRAILTDKRGSRYPGFSDGPLAAFHDLAYDPTELCHCISRRTFRGVCDLRGKGGAMEENPWYREAAIS